VLRLYALFVLIALAMPATAQNPREKKVRGDKQKVEADGYWIYNDLPKAFTEAKQSDRPMVVVLRCIPCEECVKLDDDLVKSDPVIRPLLEKFVRVRVVSTNGLDLSLFQYDTDQSFAVFFLNADGTIYGRFGTRSHRTNWVGDVSLAGLAKALQGALDLHAGYPGNKSALAGKRGPAPEFPTPEQFPALKPRYTDKLNYAGNVVQSCIHCHQIGEARRMFYRQKGGPMPEEVLFPFPHPKAIGLVLDPKERATVREVEKGSFAEKAGIRAGDSIASLAGQPLLSIADVQWVLHRTPADGGTVPAVVSRDGKSSELTLALPKGWRRLDTLSWRASSWGLRRMAIGGMLLEETDAGLRVKFVQNGAAKNAGVQVGDVIAEFDGLANPRRETDVLAHSVTERKPGDKVTVTVIRDRKKLMLTLLIPD
jgi:serine protease Do